MAQTFTDSNFEAEVIQSNKLAVIDFWATWCGPCVALTPTIEALATEYEGRVNIGKVNVDNNPQLTMQFGIRNIPTLLFIKNGELAGKHVGIIRKPELQKKIDELLQI